MRLEARTIVTLGAYVAVMVLLWVARPGITFYDDGRPRPFGIEHPDGTLVSFGVLSVLVAFTLFFAVGIVWKG